MADIAATPSCGYSHVSTFSGCGGSCLGFKLAGYQTLYAVEFVDEAARTYRANFPGVTVDQRDIRQITADDILRATGLEVGALDVLEGSPPCSSFSMAGSRAGGWGKAKRYSDDKVQRCDDLFGEFIRLLRGLKPKVVTAENVAGLTRGVAKGYFLEILSELKASGYRIAARILDASWLGVPQARQRLIFVGVRDDLNIAPVHPSPLPYQFTIRDALPHLKRITADRVSSKTGAGAGTVVDIPTDRPIQTITACGIGADVSYDWRVEPETDITGYAIGHEWDRMQRPGTQSTKYFQLQRPEIDAPCPTITATGGITGAAGVVHPTERRKFSIAELRALSGFPADFQLTGTYRQQWERIGRSVPPPLMYHVAATIRDSILARVSK
ncbi:MAG: DNA cytosine methyltransferase [Planctomycetaceae bacterium]|nr:DNA cytosine methyltransferase [Planctomycetaceae bacterium]